MNPYAFPATTQPGDFAQPGMAMRDYFAAKAMQALIAGLFANPNLRHDKNAELFDASAKSAYRIADAMLKESEKQ